MLKFRNESDIFQSSGMKASNESKLKDYPTNNSDKGAQNSAYPTNLTGKIHCIGNFPFNHRTGTTFKEKRKEDNMVVHSITSIAVS